MPRGQPLCGVSELDYGGRDRQMKTGVSPRETAWAMLVTSTTGAILGSTKVPLDQNIVIFFGTPQKTISIKQFFPYPLG